MAEEVDVQRLSQGSVAALGMQAAARRDSGVGHQDVDAPEGVAGGGDGAVAVAVRGDIAGEGAQMTWVVRMNRLGRS